MSEPEAVPGGEERSALLVLRVWVDEGGLRARITEVLALDGPEQQVAGQTTVDGICDLVLRWLQRFVADPVRPSGSSLSSLPADLSPNGGPGEEWAPSR